MMDADETLEISVDRGVLEVHIRRAGQQNAIDDRTAMRLTDLLEDANLDRAVRSVLLTGDGRYFCTGAQVTPAATDMSIFDYRWGTRRFTELTRALWEIEKPVVSAVNGTVAGAGWMVALLADLVVAIGGARWTHVFLRRGMVPHAGDTYYMPRIVPFHQLMAIAFLSDTVTSETLLHMGVINQVVAEGELMAASRELAVRLAEGPTRSIGLAKRLYRSSLTHDLDTALQEERDATALLSRTADRVEGMRAWVERRPAVFVGD
jgi:2-(1,2-epoxy-1,2-dihydrophenyl)acetyl-CoA isomerase